MFWFTSFPYLQPKKYQHNFVIPSTISAKKSGDKKDLYLTQLESIGLGNNNFGWCLPLLITSLHTLLFSATAVQNMVALFLWPAGLSVLVHILLLGMKNVSAAYSRLFCRVLLSIFHFCWHIILLWMQKAFRWRMREHSASLYKLRIKTSFSISHSQRAKLLLPFQALAQIFTPSWRNVQTRERVCHLLLREESPQSVCGRDTFPPRITAWLW